MILEVTFLILMAPQQQPTAANVISKMLAHYAGSTTMTGSITLTAVAPQGTASMETRMQYELPSKLYIRQTKGGAEPMEWLVLSNGKTFTYDAPSGLPGQRQRLAEKVAQPTQVYGVKDIYAAASASLGDRSFPLDVAIGRTEDLKFDRDQWANWQLGQPTKLRDKQVNVISGDWREYGNAQPSGVYEMYITPEGDLMRYSVTQMIGAIDANGNRLEPQKISLVWDVNLVPNGKVDPDLFRVFK